MPWLLALLLAACVASSDTTAESSPGDIEYYCELAGKACGRVFEFALSPADTPTGIVELCVLDEDIRDAVHRYGPARLSTHERFDLGNLCILICPPNTGRGCNAFSGCWCEP